PHTSTLSLHDALPISMGDLQSSEYAVFRASHEQCELWQLWQNHESCRRSARDAVCASVRLLTHFATHVTKYSCSGERRSSPGGVLRFCSSQFCQNRLS